MKQNGSNDGGENSFYKFPDWVKDADTLAEYLELDFYMGNVLKTLWANLGNRHSGTNHKREAKKRIHYSQREYEKITRGEPNEETYNEQIIQEASKRITPTLNYHEFLRILGMEGESSKDTTDLYRTYFDLRCRLNGSSEICPESSQTFSRQP